MTETKRAEDPKKERKLQKEIEIVATQDEVWKMLTDPRQLANWFPLEARVTPGVGGKMFLSWGPEWEGEGEIVAWEPGKRLAWKSPFALQEWTIEASGGKTVLRLVQTGFLGNEDWENEWFESTSYGWGFMLLGLKWAMEQHRGATRQVAWPRVKTELSREEAYRRLMVAGSFFDQSPEKALREGAGYSLQTFGGEKFSGSAEFLKPLRGFCISVRELNDALLWFTIEGSPGQIQVQAWLSAFELPQSELENFTAKWEPRLKEIFSS
jgi:uncharacterized protein YndB with AHSA1/START domain